MAQPTAPTFFPPIDDKIPPEVQTHLRLLYDRAQNHYVAIGNLQTQIDNLTAQLNALQQK
jgi:hypothetical protein